jgi:hypothetical protein
MGIFRARRISWNDVFLFGTAIMQTQALLIASIGGIYALFSSPGQFVT